ncbi:MAG: hypothetical protein D6753_15395 [Planctomycetota bacterium]|nr:MAG: hypothetical protein D6753_15395 [Planctomycetota bacterium]
MTKDGQPRQGAPHPQQGSMPDTTTDRSDRAMNCLVRVGAVGQIGRFRVVDRTLALRRGDWVVCRTARGLEAGQVVNPTPDFQDSARVDGQLLRPMAPADHFLWQHLNKLAETAQAECRAWLANQTDPVVLIEVEPLLDGRTLYFHFLSDVPDAVQQYVQHLAQIYERQVQESEVALQLETGCGPGCGTDAAAGGCGTSSGCAVCAVAGACHQE